MGHHGHLCARRVEKHLPCLVPLIQLPQTDEIRLQDGAVAPVHGNWILGDKKVGLRELFVITLDDAVYGILDLRAGFGVHMDAMGVHRTELSSEKHLKNSNLMVY